MFFVALRGMGIAPRHETILGIKHPTFGIDPQALPDRLSTVLDPHQSRGRLLCKRAGV
jgi:hypothetical protein